MIKMTTSEKDEHDGQNIEKDTYPCPNCGEPQKYFIHRGMGWVRCPSCDTGIKKKEIPEEYHHLIKRTKYIPKDKKKEPEVLTLPGEEDEEDEDDEHVPFYRPKPAYKLLSSILKQFGVKDKARVILVTRCKRAGIKPQELIRLLGELDSGLRKGEANFVAEEYYYALKKEEERKVEARGPYYDFDDDVDDSEYSYGVSPRTPVRRVREKVMPWEREKRQDDSLSKEDVLNIITEALERKEKKDRLDNLQEAIMNIGNAVREMQMRIESGELGKATKSEEDKIDSLYRLILKQEQSKNTEIREMLVKMQELANKYNQQVIEIYKQKAETRPLMVDTSGYKNDSIRFLADTIQSSANLLAQNKPLEKVTQAAAMRATPPQQPLVENPVKIEEKKSGILSYTDPNFIDEE